MGAFALAQAGDAEALASLVRQHMPLVQALSRRFSYSEDAFQMGCMGLVTAIRRFREEEGCQFSTYAVPVILGQMRKAFSRNLGWRSRAALNRANSFRERMLRVTGQEPTIRQMAAAAQVPPEELTLLMERDQPPVYDQTGELFSALPDPQGEEWLLRFCIQDIFSRLPSREQWLLQERFLSGRTQTDIAKAMAVPQYQVSRWEKQARLHFRQAWEEV